MAEANQWDLHCKLVVTAGLAETLRHAGVTVDARALRPRPVDLPATARRADLVFATPDGATVVHVEIQQRPDPAIGRRMMGYAARIAEDPAYRTRIRDLAQVVVQVTGRRPMDTRYRLGELSNSAALVHVPTIPVDDLLETSGLAPFAMVSGGRSAVGRLVARVAEVEGPDLRVAMLALAMSLDPRHSGAIMDELRRDDMTDVLDELRRTDWGRGLLAEGRQEGRQEGRHEGEAVARLAAVVDVLSTRFPDADPAAVHHTAARVVDENRTEAVRAALALDTLDTLDPRD